MFIVEGFKFVSILKNNVIQFVFDFYGFKCINIDVFFWEIYVCYFYVCGWLFKLFKCLQVNGVVFYLKKGCFVGKVVVVIGVLLGIGVVVVVGLVREGVYVVIVVCRIDVLEVVKWKMNGFGKVFIYKIDVMNKQQVEFLMKIMMEKFGFVDIFVSCVGVMYFIMMVNC